MALTNGNYAVAWTDEYNGSTTDTDVRGKIYSQSGTEVSSFTVGATLGGESNTAIAALTGGGFVVTYTLETASNNGDVAFRVFNASGVSTASGTVASGASVQGASAVAATSDGGFVVTWTDASGGTISMQAYDGSGTAVGSPLTMLSSVPNAGAASLTTLGDGRILAGYQVTGQDDAKAMILDPRATTNTSPAYGGWQVGTVGNDTIDAAAGATRVYGAAGKDTITVHGLVANGIVDGGAGLDTLVLTDLVADLNYSLATSLAVSGGKIMTASGFERFSAADSGVHLTIYGTTGDNVLTGGLVSDKLNGNAGHDCLIGNAGDDALDGGAGNDAMEGGAGNDSYVVGEAGDTVVEVDGGGTDTVRSTIGYTLGDFVENLELLGSTSIGGIGNALANELVGNANENTLDGRGGADTMIGGDDNDTYYVDDAGDAVVEGTGEGGADQVLASASYALGAGMEVELLSTTDAAGTSAIALVGNELANVITGNAGANMLDGDGGADALAGLGGDDWYFVDNVLDSVIEGAAEGDADRIYASVNYTQASGVHVEKLTMLDNNGTSAINLTGNELANVVYGNAGANVLEGKDGNDTLSSLAGNDTLVGGLGNDWMVGGAGDDWFYVDSTSDTVIELAGEGTTDRILTNVSYTLAPGVDIERLSAYDNNGTAAINLTGNAVGNVIYGNAAANVLDGRGGADLLAGLAGDDSYYVDHASDTVSETVGNGTDRIYASVSYALGAGVQVERLTTGNNGGTGAINLTGNELANVIYGNAGANVLDGKAGADTLVGLEGQDSFAFTSALGSGNVDAISGFSLADDTIVLDDAVFAGLASGALTADAFATGAAATQADDRVIYNAATGALLFDADGADGAAAVQFATLAGGLALTSADFLVV